MDVRPCALVVEDEVSLALELEDAMSAMDFTFAVWHRQEVALAHSP
jgi:hypothetical protein